MSFGSFFCFKYLITTILFQNQQQWMLTLFFQLLQHLNNLIKFFHFNTI